MCGNGYNTSKPGRSISYKTTCATSEESDQLAHMRSLITGNAVRMKTLLFHRVRCEDSDQTARMRRLI